MTSVPPAAVAVRMPSRSSAGAAAGTLSLRTGISSIWEIAAGFSSVVRSCFSRSLSYRGGSVSLDCSPLEAVITQTAPPLRLYRVVPDSSYLRESFYRIAILPLERSARKALCSAGSPALGSMYRALPSHPIAPPPPVPLVVSSSPPEGLSPPHSVEPAKPLLPTYRQRVISWIRNGWQRMISAISGVWRRVMIRDISPVARPNLDPLVRDISISVITALVISSCNIKIKIPGGGSLVPGREDARTHRSFRLFGGEEDRKYNHDLVKNIIADVTAVPNGLSFAESLRLRGALTYRQQWFADFLINRYYEGNRILPNIIERLLVRVFEGLNRFTPEQAFYENLIHVLQYANSFLIAHIEGTVSFIDPQNQSPFQTEIARSWRRWEEAGHLRLRGLVVKQFFGHIFSQIPDFTFFDYFTSSKWKIVNSFGRFAEYYIGRVISRVSILFLKVLVTHHVQSVTGHSIIAFLHTNQRRLTHFGYRLLDEVNGMLGRTLSKVPGAPRSVVLSGPTPPPAPDRDQIESARKEIDRLIWNSVKVLKVESTMLSSPRDGRREGQPNLTQLEMVQMDRERFGKAYDSADRLRIQVITFLECIHLKKAADPSISRAAVAAIFTKLSPLLKKEALIKRLHTFFQTADGEGVRRGEPKRRTEALPVAVRATVNRVAEFIPKRVLRGLFPLRSFVQHCPRAAAVVVSGFSRFPSVLGLEGRIEPIAAKEVPHPFELLEEISSLFSAGLPHLAMRHPGFWKNCLLAGIKAVNTIVETRPAAVSAETV